ncbi:MAG: pyridoxal phosphate-dependent aminotransferase [Fusobacteriaceae bacterium]
MKEKKIEHGANLYEISKNLGLQKQEILDFSSNINPFGASQKGKEAIIKNIDSVSIYPDPEYIELKKSISEYSGVKKENIILGSGATELISALIKSVNPKKTLLLSPAYSEYERELKKIECHIHEFYYKKENDFQIDLDELLKKIKESDYDLIIICNPNNPTGFSLSADNIKKILEIFTGILMIDETYIEFTEIEKYSASSLVEKYSNLFVIRGTSKFFGTPGIRLGYAFLGEGKLREKITSYSNLWNINIFATIMGEAMFRDLDYISECRKKILEEKRYLEESLDSFQNIKAYKSSSNFILCQILDKNLKASYLRDILLEEGIVIRDASHFTGLNDKFFRICILNNKDNIKLVKNLEKIFGKK